MSELDKPKQADREPFKANTFDSVRRELIILRGTGTCDREALKKGTDALTLLIEKGGDLEAMGLPVMEYITAALHHIYPAAGTIEMGVEMTGLLEDERAILEKVANGEGVSEDEMIQILNFFTYMWDELVSHSKGKPPTIQRKTAR